MSEHTQTPWKQMCFLIMGPRNEHVTHTGMGNLPPSRSAESEANAAFIVEACNNHDRLTRENEALTKVLQATQGRIMNAKIDLGSGHTKAQVSRTLQGIIEFVDGALSLKEDKP